MGKAKNRARFFGRRKAQTVEAERPQQWEEHRALDPRSGIEQWLRWLELETELKAAKQPN
jgi:hypothetical protein